MDLSTVNQIYTGLELDHLYILDSENSRVIMVQKMQSGNGLYRRQLVFEEFPDIKDIYVNKSEDKIYLLTGKEIYQVDL